MAAKKNNAMDQLLAKAKAELEMAMNKGIADKLAERDSQLFEQLSVEVAAELSAPKPKRTRKAKNSDTVTPDAASEETPAQGDGDQLSYEQHDGEGHHG